ncbi:DUF4892 domain-containing protein [Pseudohongiella nitratireducens]|nr:DUF4892 domain-containing protein [Pseudohongiella nitratireducens]MDF1624459.1 DUF4892 domain-containing protein [Pseudohongiella nitratireducens]
MKKMRMTARPCLTAWRSLVTAMSVLLLAWSSWSQAAEATDFPGIDRFPGAEIADYREADSINYSLVLGRMQRIAGQVTASASERFQGNLTRITYQIPNGFSEAEVYAFYRDQLISEGQRELFTCQGRGCGSSNYWANEIFDNRILYGPVQNQRYLAATFETGVPGDSQIGYAALYVVRRANQRLYAHLDLLALTGRIAEEQRAAQLVTPAAMQQRLTREGSVVVPSLRFNDSDELEEDAGIALLADVLQRDRLLEVFVVGHLQQSNVDLQTLQQQSLARAETVRQQLIEAGVDGGRIIAAGVGPLAPYCRPGPCGQRIEVVVRQ